MSTRGRQGPEGNVVLQTDSAPSSSNYSDPIGTRVQAAPSLSRSEGGTQSTQGAPRATRTKLPPCVKCKQQPKTPHAVYCCGSMYCHHCLVTKLTEASNRGESATCDNCHKSLGDSGPTRNKRRLEASEASSVGPDKLSGPNARMPRLDTTTTTVNPNQNVQQFTTLSNWIPHHNTMQNTTLQPNSKPYNYTSAPSTFSFQAEHPTIPYSSLSHAQSNLGTNSSGNTHFPIRAGPTHFSSEPRIMNPPMFSPEFHFKEPSIECSSLLKEHSSLPLSNFSLSGGSASLSGEISSKLTDGSSSEKSQTSDQAFSTSHYKKSAPTRLTSTGAQQAQRVKNETLINDMDEILPKPPNPFTIEEEKIKEVKERASNKLKYEKKDDSIAGPECGVCWENSKKPISTYCCNTTYCYNCLMGSLRMRPRCPTCNRKLSHNEFSYSYKTTEAKESIKPSADVDVGQQNVEIKEIIQTNASPINIEGILGKFKPLDEFTLSIFIEKLSNIREQKYKEKSSDSRKLLSFGLRELIKESKFSIQVLKRKEEAAIQDKNFLDGGYSRNVSSPPRTRVNLNQCSLYEGVFSAISGISGSGYGLNSSGDYLSIGLNKPVNPTIQVKDERLKKHFDAFYSSYNEIFDKTAVCFKDQTNIMSQNRINSMIEVSDGITKYGNTKKICDLISDSEQTYPKSIISSLEFDHLGERFVVAGVTKKIKIYNFESIISNPQKSHVPLVQLDCQNKISSVSWNPVECNTFASSDYSGYVSIWNVDVGKEVKVYREHEKRCWTVHFNNQDQKIIASGSDDAKVKIWNLNCARSVAQIDAKVNVCSVNFSPHDRNQLIIGCADYAAHLYDIRNIKKPVNVFRGHTKAISYVKYIEKDQIVSASTDSTLRVWNINENRCAKVLRGHTNDKSFVGLSGNGNHIICGSESARAFIYYKDVSDPLLSYTMGKENNPNDDSEGFVSSVSWKKNSDYVVIGNSRGKVHIVQLN